jgi:LacI family transcriptional regulator
MNVPYDLSIAGFEDSPFSRQSWPPLTTAKQATEDIARQAARLLIAGIRQDAYDEHPIAMHNQGFAPQLVVRGSTAPMRRDRAQERQVERQPERGPERAPERDDGAG